MSERKYAGHVPPRAIPSRDASKPDERTDRDAAIKLKSAGHPTTTESVDADCRTNSDVEGRFAQRAQGCVFSDEQNALLASIEARLTKEMGGLVASITQFAGRSELICKEIPDSAKFCQLITGSVRLTCLQFAVALGKGLDKPIFFDDGRQYMADLGLSLDELFREVTLDGRRFLAIALVDQQAPKLDRAADAGEQ